MRAKRTDKSQPSIVAKLRDALVPVIVTNWGHDFPDLVLGCYRKAWALVEVKEIDGDLSRGQLKFLAIALGPVAVVTDFNEAHRVAVDPDNHCLSTDQKVEIAKWLTANPNQQSLSVRKYKTLINI